MAKCFLCKKILKTFEEIFFIDIYDVKRKKQRILWLCEADKDSSLLVISYLNSDVSDHHEPMEII